MNDTVDVPLHVDRDQLQNDNEWMETFDEGKVFRIQHHCRMERVARATKLVI